MVFDLRGALLKKEEVESARLMDFEFRLRARTMRLLAARIGMLPADLVARIAHGDDEAILAELAASHPDIGTHFAEAREGARRQLVAERGDPTPYKRACSRRFAAADRCDSVTDALAACVHPCWIWAACQVGTGGRTIWRLRSGRFLRAACWAVDS